MQSTTGSFGAQSLGCQHPKLAQRDILPLQLGAYSGAQTAQKPAFSISPKLFVMLHFGAFLPAPTPKNSHFL
jgi:hypothetical protein